MEATHADPNTGNGRRCPYCFEEIHAEAVKCRHCRSHLSPPPRSSPAGPEGEPRAPSPRMLLGVCSWLSARYLIPVTLVRVLFVLAVFFHGFGILLYLALWAVLPACGDRDSRAGAWVRSFKRILLAVKQAVAAEFSGLRGRGAESPDTGSKIQGPGTDSR